MLTKKNKRLKRIMNSTYAEPNDVPHAGGGGILSA
jgi:hypothetical protein